MSIFLLTKLINMIKSYHIKEMLIKRFRFQSGTMKSSIFTLLLYHNIHYPKVLI